MIGQSSFGLEMTEKELMMNDEQRSNTEWIHTLEKSPAGLAKLDSAPTVLQHIPRNNPTS